MRNQFDKKLEELNNLLIEMGASIENAITDTTVALKTHDVELAQKVIDSDYKINRREREIESICLKLILHEQPIAGDLRLISTALKMITDMERIGDHASDISEIILTIDEMRYIDRLEYIPQMAKVTTKMVNRSIDAFINKDKELAESVIDMDDVVDELFDNVRTKLVELIHNDKNNGEEVLNLMMIAKYMERIGDHAVNVAEWVIFSITGEHKNKRIM